MADQTTLTVTTTGIVTGDLIAEQTHTLPTPGFARVYAADGSALVDIDTAPADLEAVKAMLVDALDRTYMHGPGDVFLIDGDELWIDGNRSMDADKLAATVAKWFAANQPTMGEKMLNMVRTDPNT